MIGCVPGRVSPASGLPRTRLTVSEPNEALSRAGERGQGKGERAGEGQGEGQVRGREGREGGEGG